MSLLQNTHITNPICNNITHFEDHPEYTWSIQDGSNMIKTKTISIPDRKDNHHAKYNTDKT